MAEKKQITCRKQNTTTNTLIGQIVGKEGGVTKFGRILNTPLNLLLSCIFQHLLKKS